MHLQECARPPLIACSMVRGTEVIMRVHEMTIEADDYPIAARRYEPEHARATVLVHGATATPQRYYAAFGNALASAGYRVITYDYRGIGASRPKSLRRFAASMTEWAEKDARAAYDAALAFEEP